MAKIDDPNYGTFARDGETTRVASSQEEAVSLRFNGWAEQKPAAGPAAKEIDAVTTDSVK